MKSEQQFEIREQRYGDRDSVDLAMWHGSGNKMVLSVRKNNLRELRDKINEYLVDNGMETWLPPRTAPVHGDEEEF